MIIAISGTPGTGKTALGKKLALFFGLKHVNLNKNIKQKKIYDRYDEKRKCYVVDTDKLNKHLIALIEAYKKKTAKKIESIEKNRERYAALVHKLIEKQKKEKIRQKLKKLETLLVYHELSEKMLKEIIQDYLDGQKVKKHPSLRHLHGLILDSHLSHHLPKRYVDLCIITKCHTDELHQRLKKRRYSKEKIMENVQAEIFDVCLEEAKKNKHTILIQDTSKDL